jgi:hypothetical protein
MNNKGFEPWPTPTLLFNTAASDLPPPTERIKPNAFIARSWQTLQTLLHHVADAWRLLMALVLALVIHVVYAWLPSPLAFAAVVVALYKSGGYNITVKERRPKRE